MNRTRLLALGVAVALVTGTGARAASGGHPTLIGAVLSTTGAFAPLGEPEANALRLAETDINAHGGVNGNPVHIEILDDEGKPETAAQLAQQLLDKGAVAIIGGTTSNTTAAIVRTTTALKRLQIYPTPTSQFWNTKAGVTKTVFETTPRNELEAAVLLDFATKQLKGKKFAILHDENAVGTAGDGAATAEMKARNIELVADESYPTGATDVTGQITRIKAQNADTVILWGASPALGLITRQLRQLAPGIAIVSATGTLSDNFLRIAGRDADGLYSDSALNFTHPAPQTAAFLQMYRAAYKTRAVQFASFAWDAAHLVAFALIHAKGAVDGNALANQLEGMKPYVGSTGTYAFTDKDHNGLAPSAIHMAVAKNQVWFTI